MDFRSFHNPDICWPIVARRVGEELLELAIGYLEILASRGRSLTWNKSFPNRNAYYSAVYRLRKAGLLAEKRWSDGKVFLDITEPGKSRLPDHTRPERYWKKKWNGIWYILFYDVPEEERKYRDTLRQFLKKMKMGCLQKSVYVAPRDIRPEFDDLVHGASIKRYAFLLESQTVLGQSSHEVVESAWDFERLSQMHGWYCEVARHNMELVMSDKLSPASLQNLAREEMTAYVTAMQDDPLLPEDLWPSEYEGRMVYDINRRLIAQIAKRL